MNNSLKGLVLVLCSVSSWALGSEAKPVTVVNISGNLQAFSIWNGTQVLGSLILPEGTAIKFVGERPNVVTRVAGSGVLRSFLKPETNVVVFQDGEDTVFTEDDSDMFPTVSVVSPVSQSVSVGAYRALSTAISSGRSSRVDGLSKTVSPAKFE